MEEKIEVRPGRYINVLTHLHPTASKTIFMLHGLGGRSEHWQAQYDALKQTYSMVAPDLLGHGKSDKPKPTKQNPYSFPELNADIHALFDRYATKENVVLGHSYGGALAASLAASHPDTIQRLMLLSPTPLAPNTTIPFLFTLPAPIMELLRPLLEKNFRQIAFDPSTSPELIEKEILISRSNPMYVIKSMVSGLISTPEKNIATLMTPSLIMLGESDKLIPPEVSTKFYQALPNHKMVTIKQAAHMANLEKPEKVNELIEGFL